MTQSLERWLTTDQLAEALGARAALIEHAARLGMPHISLDEEGLRFKPSKVGTWLKSYRGSVERAIIANGPGTPTMRRVSKSRRVRALKPPPAAMTPYRGWIYAIQCGGPEGNVKIGMARDPLERLRVLQTGAPEVLRLIAAWRTDSRSEESRLHRLYGHLRVHGEWFRADPELIQVVTELGGDFDPYRLEAK